MTDQFAKAAHYTLIAAKFNEPVVDGLIEGAKKALRANGVPEANVTLLRVPGAFEIPLAAQQVAAEGRTEAIIALGAVIRGATPHFDFVAGECAAGLTRVMLDTGVPIAFGVLTTDTADQAFERAGKKPGSKASNKGADAAMTALDMVSLLRSIK